MKKVLKKISVLFLCINTSCYISPPFAPNISYQNLSNNFVRDVTVIWSGRNLPTPYKMNPGGSGASSFQVRKESFFYGPVHISWKNAKGKVITKDFIFTEKNLKGWSFKDATVNLYITQEDVLLFVWDKVANMSEDENKLRAPFMGKYSDYHTNLCPNYRKLGAPPCKIPIKSDPEWEKISEYYISKYGVNSLSQTNQ